MVKSNNNINNREKNFIVLLTQVSSLIYKIIKLTYHNATAGHSQYAGHGFHFIFRQKKRSRKGCALIWLIIVRIILQICLRS
jgi:hypothetical protein